MKRNSKKGFTLMEMLIVVAIIAVLAAIAIPTFSGTLKKANEAADIANVRAAYAEAVSKALTNGTAYDGSYSGPTLHYDLLTWSVDTKSGDLSVTYAATTTDPLVLTAEAVNID